MTKPNDALQGVSIDHVEFFVPDRLVAAKWYQGVLGFKVLEPFRDWAKDSGGPLMISSDGGSTKLALFTGTPQGDRQTAGFHRVAFRLSGDAFEGFCQRLGELKLRTNQGKAVKTDSVVEHGKAYSIYFSDPYGHQLEVTTYDVERVREFLHGLGG